MDTDTQTSQSGLKEAQILAFAEGRKRGQTVACKAAAEAAKQRRMLFAREYLANGENGTQAAISAGYSAKSAASTANRLLKLDDVRMLVDDARKQAMDAANVSTEWVVERLKLEASTAQTDSARVKALELLGRITGAYAPERKDLTVEQHGFWSNLNLDEGEATVSADIDDEDLNLG